MSRQVESKEAVRALSTHNEVVDEACYEHAGVLHYSESNKAAIAALTKHQLAYDLDDEHGVQIHTLTPSRKPQRKLSSSRRSSGLQRPSGK